MAKRTKDDSDEGSAGSEADVNYESEVSEPERPLKKSKTTQKKASTSKKETKVSRSKKTKEKSESPSEGPSRKGDVGTGIMTNTEGDKYVDLGKRRRITVRSFRGAALIDIREFYEKDGSEFPGKKGISLSPEQWEELKSNMKNIDNMISKMK